MRGLGYMLMSRKNHKMVGGKLLRTDKQFRHLKQSQKEKINEWLYQEYRNLCLEQNRQPSSKRNGEILAVVMEKIGEADIWIPEYEVLKYFKGKKNHYRNRMEKELLKKGMNEDMTEKQLSVETIQGAVAGDQDAVQKVIEHYSDYIDDLCTIEETQEDESTKKSIDEDMWQAVILKLIESLPKFD